MSKIEIVKTLLRYVGRQDLETDRAICSGAICILESIEEEKVQEIIPETVPKPKATPSKPKNTETKPRQKFDVGKLGALRKAGWSVSKIADEMGVSEQTIRNYMKRENIT